MDGEKYGGKIKDLNSMCEDWGINFEHYDFITSNLPWYFKKFRRNKTGISGLLNLIELDEQNVPIELNIFELVEQVYVIYSIQIICISYFGQYDKYIDLTDINTKMLKWLLENL